MSKKATIKNRRGEFYYVEDKPYISVTKILSVISKPALRYWFGGEVYTALQNNPELSRKEALAAPWKMNKSAKDRGSTVHSIIESWKTIKEVPDVGGAYSGYADAFSKWLSDMKVDDIVEHERTVISDDYGYAGTLDLLVKINGQKLPTLIDIKTGKNLYKEVHFQLSAYECALNENGQKTEGTGALLLNEDGTYKYEVGKDKLKGFVAALELWKEYNSELLEKVNYSGRQAELPF